MVTDTSSYDPAYFEKLFAIEDRHFWFRSRNRVIGAAVAPIVAPLAPGYRVLEVGCGTGNVLQMLERVCSHGRVIGLDLFGEAFPFASRRVTCPLVRGDIYRLPFACRFDLIGAFDVIEHLDDDVGVLHELAGRLTPGGALVVTVPAHMWLWSYFDEASHHCRRYESQELSDKLTAAGLRVEYVTPFMAAIMPAMWLARRLSALRLTNGTPSRIDELASRELRTIPIVNTLAQWALACDSHCVAHRRSLPCGTSLLAVARREP